MNATAFLTNEMDFAEVNFNRAAGQFLIAPVGPVWPTVSAAADRLPAAAVTRRSDVHDVECYNEDPERWDGMS